MSVIRVYHKTAVERRRFYVDYDCWLADDEQLTDLQLSIIPFTADAPVTADTGYPDEERKKLIMFIGGGLGNTTYTLQMVVRTDSGQIKRDDIGLRVLP